MSMFHFHCPGCAARMAVADAERVGKRCGVCEATRMWESLPPVIQETIDAAVRRGNMPGLFAMRESLPSFGIPQAMDLLVFRRAALGMDGSV
ncbi:hypothetical protein Aca07nite_02600 [Actinoplanes capillaceus]|uniref:Uncharacterized protein n=1 Tax=Actinoplanes campanulatus TaxID=113559 RepID=A0ABQ3WAY0_9ACTN|nr:hypothetical protein [Actinoplanes capillaceus]GID42985.1 hypothetical protein Aca07nite_02600 [Actinoplanes capillaceus]